ncbi:MAG TPA: homoserine kinase [Verrucomicrobiae bacterium]|nr:homoserine kinase [Verrucomicrobiae bacterium]
MTRVTQFRSATIQIPASTSNLGSGFDTLGLALKVYNRVRVTRANRRGVQLISAVAETDRAGAVATLMEAARHFFRRTKTAAFGIEVEVASEFPVSRGLGFSATVRLGVIAGLNEISQAGLGHQGLLDLVTELEGHPDNASPAIFGGFTVSSILNGKVRCLPFPVSKDLKSITLIPRFGISTEKARALLPAQYTKADAAHALNRTALITAAFAQRNYEALRGLFDDRIHQPYRAQLIPQLPRVIAAGEKAGAIGGFLSGSGSAIICLTLENPDRVGLAMLRQLPDAEVKVFRAENRGFSVGDRA